MSSTGGSGSTSNSSSSWRDPVTGITYHNITDPTSSYQTQGINGGNTNVVSTPSVTNNAHNTSNYNQYSNPTDADLYSGNFHSNYITGNALWTDSRLNNAQRAMIEANYYATQAGNVAPYSPDQIQGAAGGGSAGWSYGTDGNNYAYVQPYQEGGQNFISPTQRTSNDGTTVVYRGYANEPTYGAYAQGTRSPQDMDYSWERTGGTNELRAGTYQFNSQGAANAAPKDITKRQESISRIKDKLNNEEKIEVTQKEPWQEALERYKTDLDAGYAEILRAQKVYNEKKAAGDIAGAEKAHVWANQIRNAMGIAHLYNPIDGSYIGGVISNPTPLNVNPNATNINTNTNPLNTDYFQTMENLIIEEELAYIEQQQALLAMERDRQIAELEMIYERQVAEGKLSVREAEEALEAEKKAIDQEYYLASQKLNIYAQNMGIQNSQQMIGLMQGDTYRKQQLSSEATDKYNKRVADIRDRINGLMNERDIGIANANAQYNSGVINASAAARLNSNNQMFNLYQSEHQNQVARQQAIEQALLQSQLRIQEMVKQGEITAQQAEVAWEREKERLAIQFGYDVTLTNMNNAAAAARAAAGRDSDDGFDLTLLREAMSLGIDPDNLPEGAKNLSHAVTLVREQMQDDAAIRRAVLERTIDKETDEALEAVAQGKPTEPKKSPLSIKGNYWDIKYRKQMEAYERQLKAYNEGKAFLDKYGVEY